MNTISLFLENVCLCAVCISNFVGALAQKLLALFYGVLCILMTVLGTVFGNLIQAAQIIWAMCGGPVLAIFLLGMLTTRTNEK
ncbi:unnamed protein product, partial [Larinioides sclopetarius]